MAVSSLRAVLAVRSGWTSFFAMAHSMRNQWRLTLHRVAYNARPAQAHTCSTDCPNANLLVCYAESEVLRVMLCVAQVLFSCYQTSVRASVVQDDNDIDLHHFDAAPVWAWQKLSFNAETGVLMHIRYALPDRPLPNTALEHLS